MRRNVFLLVTSTMLLPAAFAAPPVVPPPPAPLAPMMVQPVMPQILIADMLDPKGGTIKIVTHQIVYKTVPQTVEEKVPVQVQQKKMVNGQEVIEIVTVFQTVVKTSYISVPVQQKIHKTWTMTADAAYDIAGKKLTKEEVFQHLQPGMAVLVLPAGQKLEPVYQRLFSKHAVVLSFSGKVPN